MSILSKESKDKIVKLVAYDEGFVPNLYKCPKGFNTIGYGFNLDKENLPLEVADFWLNYLLEDLESKLPLHISSYNSLNDARKYVLINMAYHMGLYGLLKFKNMLNAIDSGDYQMAAEYMRDSLWYRDFPNRANRLVSIMIKGTF